MSHSVLRHVRYFLLYNKQTHSTTFYCSVLGNHALAICVVVAVPPILQLPLFTHLPCPCLPQTFDYLPNDLNCW